jgi:hypothetical protein
MNDINDETNIELASRISIMLPICLFCFCATMFFREWSNEPMIEREERAHHGVDPFEASLVPWWPQWLHASLRQSRRGKG